MRARAKRISWVGYNTRQMKPMVAFLRDVMGCFIETENESVAVAVLPNGDRFELFNEAQGLRSHFTTGVVPSFYVDDVEASQRTMEAAGISFFSAPQKTSRFSWSHFKAPDGTIMALASGRYEPPAMYIEEQRDEYTISTDKRKLNIEVIHRFLSTSYWANKRPLEIVRKSIENSLCYGIYFHNEQIGFCRVVTDFATFAYLADVFVLENHRGKGLSKWLMGCVMKHPELQGLRRWTLATKDAHGLYGQFGFKSLHWPERWMEKFDENA